MAKRKGGTYWFGPSWIVAIILAIIPIVNWVLGVVHRLVRGNLLGAVVYFFFGGILGYVDLFTIIVFNKIILLA